MSAGVSQQALTSVCNPLGEGVSQQIKDKIRNGVFIDFYCLIEKEGDVQDSSSDRALSLNEFGQVVIRDKQHATDKEVHVN